MFSRANCSRGRQRCPGVRSAAIAGNHPLDPGFTNSFTIVGRESEARSWPEISIRRVTAGYFATVGLQLVNGRLLLDSDTTTAHQLRSSMRQRSAVSFRIAVRLALGFASGARLERSSGSSVMKSSMGSPNRRRSASTRRCRRHRRQMGPAFCCYARRVTRRRSRSRPPRPFTPSIRASPSSPSNRLT